VSGYAQLDSGIIHSTIWSEPNHVRIVWITMLAIADARGYVGASVPGLAHSARVSIEECVEALELFQQPDQYSRDKEYEGRRIEACEGGWLLLNYRKRRELRDPEKRREQNREAQARWRANHREQSGKPDSGAAEPKPNISQSQPESARVSQESAQVEEEAKADQEIPPTPQGGETPPPDAQPRFAKQVRQVFDHWVRVRGKDPKRVQLTTDRKRKIEARLRERYSVADICAAIDGVARSPHHCGENDTGQVWDDLTLICRSGSKLEMFRDMQEPRTRPGMQPNHGRTGAENARIL